MWFIAILAPLSPSQRPTIFALGMAAFATGFARAFRLVHGECLRQRESMNNHFCNVAAIAIATAFFPLSAVFTSAAQAQNVAATDAAEIKQLEASRKALGDSRDPGRRTALGDGYFSAAGRRRDRGDFEGAIELLKIVEQLGSTNVPRAYSHWGRSLAALAEKKTGADSDKLFAQAAEKYQKALALKPDYHDVYYNWGIDLEFQAKARKGAEADRLFALAGEKYLKAVTIQPDADSAWERWGIMLTMQAASKKGPEAERLLISAGEKLQKAVTIKPGEATAWHSWGYQLARQGQNNEGTKAELLFTQAGEKYQKAIALKPDYHEAWANWGRVFNARAAKIEAEKLPNEGSLSAQFAAIKKRSDLKASLWKQACEKFEKAVTIKPDKHQSWFMWGDTLDTWAREFDDDAAKESWTKAEECFRKAVALKPDYFDAWYVWGIMLTTKAESASGAEKEALFKQSIEKLERATALKPDDIETLLRTGYGLINLAHNKKGPEREKFLLQAIEKYRKTTTLKPDHRAAWTSWGFTLVKLAYGRPVPEADKMLVEAEQKYLKALQIDPTFGESLFNYACISGRRGRAAEAVERLRKWLPRHKFSPVGKVENEQDFDRVRNAPEFVAFMAELKKTQSK